MSPPEPSRATEVLDRLVRDQQRRSLFRRGDPGRGRSSSPIGGAPDVGPSGSSNDASSSDGPSASDAVAHVIRRAPQWDGSPGRWPPIGGRQLVTISALVLAALVVVAFVVLQRRPASIEERLPLASAGSTTVAVASSSPAGVATSDGGGATATETGSSDSAGSVVVHVAGAVSAPGVVELPAGSRVVDAVRSAGGLRADADPDRVNLAAPLTDGQRIAIPALGQPEPVEVAPTGPAPAGGGSTDGGDDGAGSSAGPVDVNSADAAQLEKLPGVGPATAAAIIAHRESDGPFSSADDLLDVRGIGEAKLEAMRDMVTVGGSG